VLALQSRRELLPCAWVNGKNQGAIEEELEGGLQVADLMANHTRV
jgi:hypothetical protein